MIYHCLTRVSNMNESRTSPIENGMIWNAVESILFNLFALVVWQRYNSLHHVRLRVRFRKCRFLHKITMNRPCLVWKCIIIHHSITWELIDNTLFRCIKYWHSSETTMAESSAWHKHWANVITRIDTNINLIAAFGVMKNLPQSITRVRWWERNKAEFMRKIEATNKNSKNSEKKMKFKKKIWCHKTCNRAHNTHAEH